MRLLKKTTIVLMLIFLGFYHASAQTNHKATIQVVNNTGSPIYNVTVLHKYSDVFKEKNTWDGVLQPGQSTPANFTVRYQTGFGRTGADWWLVTWTEAKDANSVVQYTTSPNNFRDIIDFYEKVGKVGIPIATAVLGVASVAAGPVVGLAVAGGSIIANEIAARTFNNASTAGFKKHSLASEDKKKITQIKITKKREVNFVSKSGKSNTVTSSRVLKFKIN
jgi:hypothetical protein